MTVADPPARRRRAATRARPAPPTIPAGAPPALPEGWRDYVGRWLGSEGCRVSPAARGDWEVELSPALGRRWRRQRVRLVFDSQRPTLPRGAWFTAPGSTAGRKILEAGLEAPLCTRRTALAQVPGAPAEGIAAVCRVRGLSWGPSRLGPVRYERRISFHVTVTRWGGLPWQEAWVLLLDGSGACIERVRDTELSDVRVRDGLYQIGEELPADERESWITNARVHFDHLLEEREEEWERTVARSRDDELARLGAFFSARIEEEEERLRRRTGNGEEAEIEQGDATSLKLEWERRAAEVRHRWALRTELRVWGVSEWSWPVAELEQELRAGAVHVRVQSHVDVARGRPAQPGCPTCGHPAEMLVRARGAVACERCGPA
jgi:hypothetical protein